MWFPNPLLSIFHQNWKHITTYRHVLLIAGSLLWKWVTTSWLCKYHRVHYTSLHGIVWHTWAIWDMHMSIHIHANELTHNFLLLGPWWVNHRAIKTNSNEHAVKRHGKNGWCWQNKVHCFTVFFNRKMCTLK